MDDQVTKKQKQKKRNRSWGAFTIPAFAKRNGMPEGMVRRAVEKGEIETFPFGGLPRIAKLTEDRIRAAMGLPPLPDEIDIDEGTTSTETAN